VEGKGQTRNWLIIAPPPAGKSMTNINSIIRKEKISSIRRQIDRQKKHIKNWHKMPRGFYPIRQ
jgi:hypothetical protein